MARRARPWLRRLRLAAEILTVLCGIGAAGLWCSLPNTRRLADENPTSTAFIDLRRAQARDAGRRWRLEWQWRPLGKISRYLRASVIYAEDARFYTHDGVDWDAIEKAFERNLSDGEMSVGGSTITQQLAKNLYLSPSRNPLRKLRELLIAYSLEDTLTKQRILELYLNVAEWGDGVFGAEAAAWKWFGHSAQSLKPSEAARLAIALPNPIKRAPDVHDEMLTKKAVRIIRLLRMQGLINGAQERQALDEIGANTARVRPDASLLPVPVPTPSRHPRRPPSRSRCRKKPRHRRRERVGLIDVDPVARALDPDPRDRVRVELRATIGAHAVGRPGNEQRLVAERCEPSCERPGHAELDELGRMAMEHIGRREHQCRVIAAEIRTGDAVGVDLRSHLGEAARDELVVRVRGRCRREPRVRLPSISITPRTGARSATSVARTPPSECPTRTAGGSLASHAAIASAVSSIDAAVSGHAERPQPGRSTRTWV